MEPALEAVARAYRTVRETGAMDYPVYLAARDTHLAARPEAADHLGLSENVRRLIADLAHAIETGAHDDLRHAGFAIEATMRSNLRLGMVLKRAYR